MFHTKCEANVRRSQRAPAHQEYAKDGQDLKHKSLARLPEVRILI